MMLSHTPPPRVAAAAGEDFTDVHISWQHVEVVVPPGPLGILLDSAEQNAAVLEGFAAIDAHGTRGTVERHGGVHPGSILEHVNQYDLTESGMTFADIGKVLRETAHLERTLGFNVPVPTVKHTAAAATITSSPQSSIDTTVPLSPPPHHQQQHQQQPPAEWHSDDDAELTAGLALVSPASVALDDDSDSNDNNAHHSPAPLSPLHADAIAAAAAVPPSQPPASTASSSSTASSTTSSNKSWSFKGFSLPKNLPKSLPNLPKSLPTLAALRSSLPSAPTSVATMLFADVSAPSSSSPTDASFVTIDVPSASSIGIEWDDSIDECAVVRGFIPLPDGTPGTIEAHGRVPRRATLVTLNDMDVRTWPRMQVLTALHEETADAQALDPRQTLTFRLPHAPKTKKKAVRAVPVPLVEDLNKRRAFELLLIRRYDKRTIDRHECWFMLDAAWMATWATFVGRNGPLPGPIANEALLDDGWEARLDGLEAGRADVPRPGLLRPTDYRCVAPMVWCLFVELYGTTRAPVLPRYVLDIDAEAVGETDVAKILATTHLQATALVQELRDKCV